MATVYRIRTIHSTQTHTLFHHFKHRSILFDSHSKNHMWQTVCEWCTKYNVMPRAYQRIISTLKCLQSNERLQTKQNEMKRNEWMNGDGNGNTWNRDGARERAKNFGGMKTMRQFYVDIKCLLHAAVSTDPVDFLVGSLSLTYLSHTYKIFRSASVAVAGLCLNMLLCS